MKKHRYPWQRRRRWLFFVVGVFVLLVAIPFILRARVQHQVEIRYQAIRAAGEPLTMEELEAWIPFPPPEQNGAETYIKAFATKILPVERETAIAYYEKLKEAPLHGPYPEPLASLAETMLDANQPRLDLLHQAAQFPQTRFALDYGLGPSMEIPHLAQLRELAAISVLEAGLTAQKGDMDRSEKALLTLTALDRVLRDEPLMMSQGTRMSIHTSASNALRRALECGSFSDTQLARLQEAFGALESPDMPFRALIGERAMRCMHYGRMNISKKHAKTGPNRVENVHRDYRYRVVLSLINLSGDSIQFLDGMRKWIDISRKPFPEALAAAAILDKTQDDEHYGRLSLSASILPTIGYHIASFARDAAELRIAKTALAVERYRVQYAKPPTALQDLVPAFIDAVPIDPFDGQPLRYRVAGNNYRIYSIANNKKDDGGEEPQKGQKRKHGEGDYVFLVQHP